MKLYKASRSPKSNREAILRLAKYGIAKVIEIGEDYILEEHVVFNPVLPNLEQIATLLKKINSEKDDISRQPLVHGDLGLQNVTLIAGQTRCLDYEYAHFGNTFADIGRVILRVCSDVEETMKFFKYYSGNIPDVSQLKEGLIYFCDWQRSLREEKNLPYQNVPTIRRERVKRSGNDFTEVINSFKSRVIL